MFGRSETSDASSFDRTTVVVNALACALMPVRLRSAARIERVAVCLRAMIVCFALRPYPDDKGGASGHHRHYIRRALVAVLDDATPGQNFGLRSWRGLLAPVRFNFTFRFRLFDVADLFHFTVILPYSFHFFHLTAGVSLRLSVYSGSYAQYNITSPPLTPALRLYSVWELHLFH